MFDKALLQCTKSKVWDKNKEVGRFVIAKNAYTGRYFTLAREIVEEYSIPYYIFSAKYGIIYPNKFIEDYNISFSSPKKFQEKHALEYIDPVTLEKQFRLYFDPKDKVLLLTSSKYYERIKHLFEKFECEVYAPLLGLPNGKAYQLMKKIKQDLSLALQYKI